MNANSALAALLLIVLAFAGCTDAGKADAKATSPSVAVGSAVYESEEMSGTIAGLVTDDEKVALEGVKMTVVELNLEVLSGQDGAYEFLNVPLGTYKLAANKLGYSAAFKKVDVTEGNSTVEADFLLEAIRIVEPRMTTQIWNGKISCGVILVPVCGIAQDLPVNPTEEKWIFEWTYEGSEVPVAMVTEMDWKPTAPGTAAALYPAILIDGDIEQSTEGPSPIKMASDEDQMKNWFKKEKQFGVYPTLADPVVDQKFTIYRTDFYGLAPAEDWTIYPS